jgi:hypothetical protein
MTIKELANKIAQAASAIQNTVARQLAEASERDGNCPEILLISSKGNEANPCVTWFREHLPHAVVKISSATEDFVPAAFAADYAILIFPCSDIPGSDLIRLWQALIADRPIGTSFVILSGSDEIESPEDRKLVEGTVQTWLMPAESAQGLPLSQLGAFLWSDKPGRDDDRDSLRDRLTSTLSEDAIHSLRIKRLALAIQKIEESHPATQKPLQIANFSGDRISELRAEILKRTREMRDDVERALRLAFEDLENRFERDLPRIAALAVGGRLVLRDLDFVTQTWEEGPAARAVDQILSQAEAANAAALKTEQHLSEVIAPSLELSPIHDAAAKLQWTEADTQNMRRLLSTQTSNAYFRTAGAVVLTPLVAVWLGLGPVGVIGGTFATTAGALTVERMNKRTMSMTTVRAEMKNRFQRQLAQTRAEYQRLLDEKLTKLIDDWKSAFDALPQPREAASPLAAPLPLEEWKENLASLS